MATLDSLDRQVISLLEKDATLAPEAIAKALGTSVSTIRRRIRNLTQNNVIRMRLAVDPDKVGANVGVLIALDVALAHLQSVIDYVSSREETTWVTATTGRYDVLISARFRSNQHLTDFLMNGLGTLEGIGSSETFFLLKARRMRVYEALG